MSAFVQKVLADLKPKLATLYGTRLVALVLFGSQARADAVTGSDIDVMLVLKGDVKPGEEIVKTGKITAELSLKYDVVISCVFMPEERYKKEQSPLLINVRREGIAA